MDNKRLNAFEAFSLSFGGQAPFTSMITYGTVALQMGGTFLPIAAIIAMLIVLLNGLVVYRLSSDFSDEGGYFTYAYFSLTKRLGLVTGWIFLMYAFTYAGTLIAGSIYILKIVISQLLPDDVLSILIIAFSSFLILKGLKVSVKYAEVISVAEITAIVISSVVLLMKPHHTFQLMIPQDIFLVTLFAIGVPSGYGNISPMGGEVKDAKKTLGIVTVSVILTGGLLSALLFYATSVYGTDFVMILKENVSFLFPYLFFSALNGGILGGIAYVIAMSRVIYAMGIRKMVPTSLSYLTNGRPLNAELASIMFYSVLLFALIHFLGVYTTFDLLGEFSMLTYLLISISADISLLRRAVKRSWADLSLSFTAFLVSIIVLVYSIAETSSPVINYVLALFLIFGFFYFEVLELVKQAKRKYE